MSGLNVARIKPHSSNSAASTGPDVEGGVGVGGFGDIGDADGPSDASLPSVPTLELPGSLALGWEKYVPPALSQAERRAAAVKAGEERRHARAIAARRERAAAAVVAAETAAAAERAAARAAAAGREAAERRLAARRDARFLAAVREKPVPVQEAVRSLGRVRLTEGVGATAGKCACGCLAYRSGS